jgi:AAA+ ATPase superfamily predicted ATPase
MRFLDREEELARLERLARRRDGGLAVVYGRRRIGKTRLLVEWVNAQGGAYTVADQSTAEVQRRYFASAVAARLPGFGEVAYPDWRVLLSRLAEGARVAKWRGPLVVDELPYLVATSPELPSVLQHWVDHEARAARLTMAVAGSSQRMMQGLVLAGDAPLYGRAREVLHLGPLPVRCVRQAFGIRAAVDVVEAFCAWGGVPRYWELAVDEAGDLQDRIDALVLDPRGPLHREPDRLLVEEVPSAVEVRPVLDAIGSGAHRVSEIAGRIGRPATSLSRPLDRLLGLGLAVREVPFGEPEHRSRRSLYRISDSFIRLWFRVVAPHRAMLSAAPPAARKRLLARYWRALAATAWEDLCRAGVPCVAPKTALYRIGPWGPASRWWRGNDPEWDLVSESVDGRRILLGEAKWSEEPMGTAEVRAIVGDALSRRPPNLAAKYANKDIVYAVFVPRLRSGVRRTIDGVAVVTGDDVIAAS